MLLVDTNTLWLAASTILTAIITTGGAIAVAVIGNRQKSSKIQIDKIHEQLKTSNGKSVGAYVEETALTVNPTEE